MGRKIAVNTRLLLSNKLEGIGTFTAEIFKILCKEHPEYEFHFIFDRKYSEEFIFSKNVIPHVINPPARHPILLKIWYNFRLPRLLKKIDPSIFISPDAVASLNTKIPSLTVIHDINFVHRPDDLPKKWSEYYNKEFSKSDIVKTYKTSPNKIDVVYNGIKSNFKPLSKEKTKLITNKYSRDKPFFFFIGSLHPRKNLKNLLLAFNEFKKIDQQGFKLIIGGAVMFKFESIEAVYKNLEYGKDVVFTGRLSDNDLNCFLSEATALTYIPFFEGFGIPVLEAMACGTAVITSNTTSLPEVVGDAAYAVSPNSISEISAAMYELSTNQQKVNELVSKGFERLKLFTWQKSADALWQSIQKTLDK